MSSCGTVKIYSNPESEFNKKTPITINLESDDKSGTLGELQFLLKSKGYNVLSYNSAKKYLSLDVNKEKENIHGVIVGNKEFKSLYILNVDYTYYWDVFYYSYTSFSATITDLVSGEIIMTANFRGDRNCGAVLNEFVEKMNLRISR